MILVAGGDSFTYGSELADADNGVNAASQNTFPALLSRDFGMEYECAAYPGFSNNAIRRTTMNACEKLQDIGLVFVTWTFPGRYEFRFNYDTEQRWGHWYNLAPWLIIDDIENIKREFKTKTDDPIILEHHVNYLLRAKRTGVLEHHVNHLLRAKRLGISEFAKTFYKNVGSSLYWETYSSLTEIIMLQQYLQLKKIPYIFSMVDELLLNNCTNLTNDGNIATLYNQIDFKRWVTFPNNQGFYTWARDSKYPFAKFHPLEPAHVDAAKYIKENYYELVKEFIQ